MNTFTFTFNAIELIAVILSLMTIGAASFFAIDVNRKKTQTHKPPKPEKAEPVETEASLRYADERRARRVLERYVNTCLHIPSNNSFPQDKWAICKGSITGILCFRDLPAYVKSDDYGDITKGDNAKVPFKDRSPHVDEYLHDLFRLGYSEFVYNQIEWYINKDTKLYNAHAEKLLNAIRDAVPEHMRSIRHLTLATKAKTQKQFPKANPL